MRLTNLLYVRWHKCLILLLCLFRSPEAQKRKAPSDKPESNGPSAKKAKPSAESSSSEESSSEDDEAAGKAAPAGNNFIYAAKQELMVNDDHQ